MRCFSVGDFPFFRKKCEKTDTEYDEKRIPLFLFCVTQYLNRCRSFAKRAIWIEKGHIVKAGTTEEVCPEYREAYQV